MKALSDELLKEIADDYLLHKEDITVKGIIEKYGLDISASKLKSILPLVNNENTCPYCKVNMVQKITGRGELSNPYCKICGHTIYQNDYQKCRCSICDDARRKIINLAYKIPEAKKNFSDLPNLLKLDIIRKLSDNDSFGIIKGKHFLHDKALLDILKSQKLICVSPESPIDAFDLTDSFPFSYYIYQVDYVLNVRFSQDEQERIVKGTCFADILSPQEKYEIFEEYMHKDVMNRFSELMVERGLCLVILPTAEENFKKLYKELSYSEIMTLCFHVARYCLDRTKTRKMTRTIAEKGALKMAITFWENDKKKGWPLGRSEVGYCGEDLKWCVEKVLRKELSILHEIVTPESL